MPPSRKRRVTAVDDDDEENVSQASTPVPRNRRQAQSQQKPQSQRRAQPAVEPEEDVENEDASHYGEDEAAEEQDGNSNASHQQLVKNFVRLALACEYSRMPIRRADISTKVLGKAAGRQFSKVFDAAQHSLRETFGMEMVELPVKENVTTAQRRAAQSRAADKAGSKPARSGAWVLHTTLPPQFHMPEVLKPPMAPTGEMESAYVGLYSFTIALITLSGGALAESKLDRVLRRVNADQSTPVDKTDKLLARMAREGYIVKIKEQVGGEEMVEYMVGPRGRTEVGDEGVAGMVRKVYGSTEGEDEELEKKLERSLRVTAASRGVAMSNEAAQDDEPAPPTQRRTRKTRKNGGLGGGDSDD